MIFVAPVPVMNAALRGMKGRKYRACAGSACTTRQAAKNACEAVAAYLKRNTWFLEDQKDLYEAELPIRTILLPSIPLRSSEWPQQITGRQGHSRKPSPWHRREVIIAPQAFSLPQHLFFEGFVKVAHANVSWGQKQTWSWSALGDHGMAVTVTRFGVHTQKHTVHKQISIKNFIHVYIVYIYMYIYIYVCVCIHTYTHIIYKYDKFNSNV